jgi:hypothetical protein
LESRVSDVLVLLAGEWMLDRKKMLRPRVKELRRQLVEREARLRDLLDEGGDG